MFSDITASFVCNCFMKSLENLNHKCGLWLNKIPEVLASRKFQQLYFMDFVKWNWYNIVGGLEIRLGSSFISYQCPVFLQASLFEDLFTAVATPQPFVGCKILLLMTSLCSLCQLLTFYRSRFVVRHSYVFSVILNLPISFKFS